MDNQETIARSRRLLEVLAVLQWKPKLIVLVLVAVLVAALLAQFTWAFSFADQFTW